MNDPREEIKKLMARVRKQAPMPSSDRVVKETFLRLGFLPEVIQAEDALKNFDLMLGRLFEETLRTLERYELASYASGIPAEFLKSYPQDVDQAEAVARQQGFRPGVAHLLTQWYPLLRRAFLSVGQGRMARGGKDFELQIQGLLDLAKLPYTKQEQKEHTDFILPNVGSYQKNRTTAIIISAKRTLRERWAEVAEELFNLRSPNVFLFTADESISEDKVNRICRRYNIHLVVWDRVKASKFAEEPLVLGYTEWATDRLAILRQRWN